MFNTAAFIPAAKAPLELKSIPIPILKDGEVLIKNTAIGLNLVDSKLARWAIFPIKYPAILGSGVAGKVQESKNPRFKVGDRVIAYLPSIFTGDSRHGAFQEYSVAVGPTIAKIPDSLSFEKASSFPMNATVAAGALFKVLGLDQPVDHSEERSRVDLERVHLCRQICHPAGYKVITTASPHNHNYVRSLGTDFVYDYSAPSTAASVAIHAPFAGILASHNAILEVLKVINTPNPPSGTIHSLLPVMVEDPNWTASVERSPVHYNFTAPENRVFANWFWSEDGFLETLLAEEGLKGTPSEVIGGLEEVNWGLDEISRGVSAKKLVVVV